MNDYFRKMIGLAFGVVFVAIMGLAMMQLATAKPSMGDSVRMVTR